MSYTKKNGKNPQKGEECSKSSLPVSHDEFDHPYFEGLGTNLFKINEKREFSYCEKIIYFFKEIVKKTFQFFKRI